jgi:hypothetical protein
VTVVLSERREELTVMVQLWLTVALVQKGELQKVYRARKEYIVSGRRDS